MHFRKITIVGVGLLGGSIGLAARKRGLAHELTGYVRRAASVKECKQIKAVHTATTDIALAVADADLVMLCTPLAQMRSLVKSFLPALKPGAIVTDVGSVKASVVADLESLVTKAGAHFVGSHPMAGAEKMGVSAARENLFEHAVCVVTPTRKTNKIALRKVEKFWQALGCRLLAISPEEHDQLVSQSSHLPHLVAAALATQVLNPKRPSQAALCAGGFRDSTRIASGSPEMWRDIALANRKELRVALDEFVRELQRVQAILRKGKPADVTRFFETAKQRRDNWCACCASPSHE